MGVVILLNAIYVMATCFFLLVNLPSVPFANGLVFLGHYYVCCVHFLGVCMGDDLVYGSVSNR